MTACKQKNNHTVKSPNIARVGSRYLTLREARRAIPDFSSKDSAYAISQYRDQWIRRQLLLREAKRLNLSNQQEVKQRLQRARTEVLLDALQQTITARYQSKAAVSRREAINYYRRHQKKLTLTERYVRFRRVETRKLADARIARRLLREDSSWVSVAKRYSLHAGRNISCSEDFWPVSTVQNEVPMLKNFAAKLDSGEFSAIRRSEHTYQFIEVTGVRQQGDTANPEWFIHRLKTWLMHEKQHSYYKSYVKNLYLSAKENNEFTIYNVK